MSHYANIGDSQDENAPLLKQRLSVNTSEQLVMTEKEIALTVHEIAHKLNPRSRVQHILLIVNTFCLVVMAGILLVVAVGAKFNLDEMNTTMKSMTTTMEKMLDQMMQMNTQMVQMNSQMIQMNGQMQSLQAGINTTNNNMLVLQKAIDHTNEHMSILESSINTTNSHMINLEAGIVSTNAQMSGLQQQMSELEKKMERTNALITMSDAHAKNIVINTWEMCKQLHPLDNAKCSGCIGFNSTEINGCPANTNNFLYY
eukprot:Colp12_sorted_trinity150504_noHs@21308